MRILKRKNRFYDTTRFGQPAIRVYHRPANRKRYAHYLLKCGCCSGKLEIYYAEDGLEIGGVNGTIEDWREILLPLLQIGKTEKGFVDKAKGKKGARTRASSGRRRSG